MRRETVEWIVGNFGGWRSVTKGLVGKAPPDVIEDIRNELEKRPEYGSVVHLVRCAANGLELKRCRACGKLLTYRQSFLARNEYCSYGCAGRQSVSIGRRGSGPARKEEKKSTGRSE